MFFMCMWQFWLICVKLTKRCSNINHENNAKSATPKPHFLRETCQCDYTRREHHCICHHGPGLNNISQVGIPNRATWKCNESNEVWLKMTHYCTREKGHTCQCSSSDLGEWWPITAVIQTFSLVLSLSWWRHQMETFSALLASCAGNSPVTGEFPAQRPVTRNLDLFFGLRLNKQSNKQSWDWWFEMPSCSSWRHCNDVAVFVSKAISNLLKVTFLTPCSNMPMNAFRILFSK